MDVTAFVVHGRHQALLYGDYSTYHSQLAKRLLSIRKKLGIATKNRSKFVKHPELPPDADKDNHVRLLLLTAERAWAQAMSFKSAQTTAQKPMSNRTRSHIVSRLNKAAQTAQQLVQLLVDSETPTIDVVEAKAYTALLRGAMFLEKRNWESCVQSYAVSRVIYSVLSTAGRGDLFKDLLSETIDPSIRYAAYQQKTPRTVPIDDIVQKAFPRSDETLVKQLEQIDPNAFSADRSTSSAQSVPQTLTWRSRQVQIEDAQISQAWAAIEKAKLQLAEDHIKLKDRQPNEKAAAYDDILTATQDAVDATKQAIEELKGEGVTPSDPRMQRLQITRTAVNYEMISWRIGRSRVLTGRQDGAPDEYGPLRRRKPKGASKTAKKEKELPISKKLAKLKEKVALYDGVLQNIESTKELPGVPADEDLTTKLDAFRNYFQALKCLAIARSHAAIDNFTNALAIIERALEICNKAASKLQESSVPDTAPLNMEVTSQHYNSLKHLLEGELARHRAIVFIENERQKARDSADTAFSAPLIERLHEYPIEGVRLDNIVQFPPQLQPIPVSPIFLDVAWNYIDYPRQTPATATASSSVPSESASQAETKTKKGWFSFGRS